MVDDCGVAATRKQSVADLVAVEVLNLGNPITGGTVEPSFDGELLGWGNHRERLVGKEKMDGPGAFVNTPL